MLCFHKITDILTRSNTCSTANMCRRGRGATQSIVNYPRELSWREGGGCTDHVGAYCFLLLCSLQKFCTPHSWGERSNMELNMLGNQQKAWHGMAWHDKEQIKIGVVNLSMSIDISGCKLTEAVPWWHMVESSHSEQSFCHEGPASVA